MLFTSFQYLLFLPTIVLLFWFMPRKWRMPLLLVSSYFFYMSWIPAFILLILLLTAFNYFWGKILHGTVEKRKAVFGFGIFVNLLVLAIFKYANFMIESLMRVLHLFQPSAHYDLAVNIILPLGISFFTFEFIHYLFEIYRGKHKPIDSFVLFALFAAFFPTQIAGPIKRFPDFVKQMQTEQKFSLSYLDEGIPLIILGLAKKLLFADNLAVLVEMMSKDPLSYGSLELWVFAYAFAFQIYFDFSGYTDVARGSAKLFGYDIPINFNMPYIASNISDFWHRWHISLSTWLRDYLFIPLGGSRGSNWQTNCNLMITMMLGGLWHGASWNFVVWGIFHGACLVAHRQFVSAKTSWSLLSNFIDSQFGRILSIILTFNAVCIGWVFFRMQDIHLALNMVKRMLILRPIYSSVESSGLLVLRPNLPVIIPVVLIMLAALLIANWPVSALNARGVFKGLPPYLKAVACSGLILVMITFMPDSAQPFIYFQF